MKRLLLIALLSISHAFAAISASTVWEVRTTGADTNGGGFVAGATGTDMSIFDNKNASGCTGCQSNTVNISVTDGVANGTTTLTSATANFSSALVGNIVYVAGGTGSIAAAWYQVASVTDASTIVVDRSTGLTAGTGVTINIGGALATISKLAANMVASNQAWVKAGTGYSTTASNTFAPGNVTPAYNAPYTTISGYTTTRGDNGKATITASTNSGITIINSTANGIKVQNFTVNCSSLATCSGVKLTGQYAWVRNSIAQNFTSVGAQTGANGRIEQCELTGGTSAAVSAVNVAGGSMVISNWVHDNACTGVMLSSGSTGNVLYNVIANNSGASSDGIKNASLSSDIAFNTIYKSGRHGISSADVNVYVNGRIRNNILVSNGQSGTGYGIALSNAGFPASPLWDGNAFYGNATGARLNMDDAGTVNPVNGVAPYTNLYDITLGADPFTNAASNDFTLNNSNPGGAQIRGHGLPGGISTLSQVGYVDMGALQHQDAGTGGGHACPIAQ